MCSSRHPNRHPSRHPSRHQAKCQADLDRARVWTQIEVRMGCEVCRQMGCVMRRLGQVDSDCGDGRHIVRESARASIRKRASEGAREGGAGSSSSSNGGGGVGGSSVFRSWPGSRSGRVGELLGEDSGAGLGDLSTYVCTLAPPPHFSSPLPSLSAPADAHRPPGRARAARLSEPEPAPCSAGASCPAHGGEAVCPPGGLPPAPCWPDTRSSVGGSAGASCAARGAAGGAALPGPPGGVARLGPSWCAGSRPARGPAAHRQDTRKDMRAHTNLRARAFTYSRSFNRRYR